MSHNARSIMLSAIWTNSNNFNFTTHSPGYCFNIRRPACLRRPGLKLRRFSEIHSLAHSAANLHLFVPRKNLHNTKPANKKKNATKSLRRDFLETTCFTSIISQFAALFSGKHVNFSDSEDLFSTTVTSPSRAAELESLSPSDPEFLSFDERCDVSYAAAYRYARVRYS